MPHPRALGTLDDRPVVVPSSAEAPAARNHENLVMTTTGFTDNGLDQKTADFYQRAMQALAKAGVPFLVGGAYALNHYTGIVRHTKDFDFFVRPEDAERTLEALAAEQGLRTEMT